MIQETRREAKSKNMNFQYYQNLENYDKIFTYQSPMLDQKKISAYRNHYEICLELDGESENAKSLKILHPHKKSGTYP